MGTDMAIAGTLRGTTVADIIAAGTHADIDGK
jgi:hypothetical protein